MVDSFTRLLLASSSAQPPSQEGSGQLQPVQLLHYFPQVLRIAQVPLQMLPCS
jgi:hypothetical protein